MPKYRSEGEWAYSAALGGGAFEYYPPGEYEDSVIVAPSIVVPRRAMRQLLPTLQAEGFLDGLLAQTSRKEDLHIIDRLLDTLQGRPVPSD